ncbi:MAG: hypothetical protein J6X34_07730, partial [Clostridia bacterium]|nr:hypothetical protein [Clostridia bacterium]
SLSGLLNHDKRGFFLHFGQKSGKYRQFRTFRRLISRPEARFFVFRTQKRRKMLVYFLRFFALQRTPKKYGVGGFEP